MDFRTVGCAIVMIGLLLTSAALLACFVPARRAAKVELFLALRAE